MVSAWKTLNLTVQLGKARQVEAVFGTGRQYGFVGHVEYHLRDNISQQQSSKSFIDRERSCMHTVVQKVSIHDRLHRFGHILFLTVE